MAVAPATVTDIDNDAVVIVWDAIDDSADAGDWVEIAQYENLNVSADGNFGSGASVMIQGSNNGVAAFPVQVHQDGGLEAFAVLAADSDVAQLVDEPRYIRPLGDEQGDENTAVVVTVIGKKRPT